MILGFVHFWYPSYHFKISVSIEEKEPQVEICEDAAGSPHINSVCVRQPKQNFWSPEEGRQKLENQPATSGECWKNVFKRAEPESYGLHFVPHKNISVPNGNSEVDQFNPHAKATLEHDVVWFYVSVYNTDSTEGLQCHEQLKRKRLPFLMSHKINETRVYFIKSQYISHPP